MKRSTSAFYRHGFVLILVVLVFGLMVTAVAAALPGSPFEGDDGNLLVDVGGKTDWVSFKDSSELKIGTD